MNISRLIKNTVKLAVASCIAAGAVSLMTTGTATKVIADGIAYAENTAKKLQKKVTREYVSVRTNVETDPTKPSDNDFAE